MREMDVACSTLCFADEPLDQALRHIAELEFSKVDLGVTDDSRHLTPTEVANDVAGAFHRIRQGPTIGFSAVTIRTKVTGEALEHAVEAIGHLAKQVTAPVVTVEASAAGTPIDAEVRRLAQLIRILSVHGVHLGLVTRSGTLTENADVAVELCKLVPGLGLALDPSYYICGPWQGRSIEHLFPYVRHVYLRDTGRRVDQLQVSIGRGEIEYGKIVSLLGRYRYGGALTVAIEKALAGPDMDVEAEARKLGRVLESLL